MNYLCNRCCSNTCSHVDPRLQKQMLDRYMNKYGEHPRSPEALGAFAHGHYILPHSLREGISYTDHQEQATRNNKLLLLRRTK